MKIFISSAHNNPSGGTKVLNQFVNLFEEHGYTAYLVVASPPKKANFIDAPAQKVISFKQMLNLSTKEDIIIDCWQSKKSWETIHIAAAKQKIFWQHGASIPKGGNTVGDIAYKKRTPYNQFWNISNACAKYIEKKYHIKQVSIVHPFFNTITIKNFQKKRKENIKREGILLLNRRGKKYIDSIVNTFGNSQKITILNQPYHENKFYNLLLQHKFFVSVDPGIERTPFKYSVKNKIKKIANSEFKKEQNKKNSWIIPKGHLLGFPMPPIEAALLKCTVIGFAMGGGLEWMNSNNCFLAKDREKKSIIQQINNALQTSEANLTKINTNAYKTVTQFSKAHSWNQIKQLLDL